MQYHIIYTPVLKIVVPHENKKHSECGSKNRASVAKNNTKRDEQCVLQEVRNIV